jgi:hypothetical protein
MAAGDGHREVALHDHHESTTRDGEVEEKRAEAAYGPHLVDKIQRYSRRSDLLGWVDVEGRMVHMGEKRIWW